ncbi:MAG TPA: V4R domain-containing protein [Gemmatimonadaceae bacterium]|jgi:predicted hydrocarbon binding protein|nr:V4R domain-containing protein [Gemmatimonadaceae bacterium]
MPDTMDFTGHHLVALSESTLGALRTALLTDADPSAAAAALQDAGYAGGDDVFIAFRDWLERRDRGEPDALGVNMFAALASQFFREIGWGTVAIGSLHDAVATIDCDDWREANAAQGQDQPSCHLTTGLLANFFGHVSDTPLAVLEVECRSMGHARCRFLLGSTEVMTAVYQAMERGVGYEEAVGEAASQ